MALKVEKGDEVSFIKLLKIFETLDGGALSDGLVAAGMFFEQNPKRFIKLTRKHNTRPDLVINSISRTPWYTVDHPHLEKSVLNTRLNILEIHKKYIDEQVYKSAITEINRQINNIYEYPNTRTTPEEFGEDIMLDIEYQQSEAFKSHFPLGYPEFSHHENQLYFDCKNEKSLCSLFKHDDIKIKIFEVEPSTAMLVYYRSSLVSEPSMVDWEIFGESWLTNYVTTEIIYNGERWIFSPPAFFYYPN